MRGYFIDELSEDEVTRLGERLKAEGLESSLEGLFWMPVPETLLTPLQMEHLEGCGPYSLALELTGDSARLEFLVRAKGRMRCECMTFAGDGLQRYAVDWLERFLDAAARGLLQ